MVKPGILDAKFYAEINAKDFAEIEINAKIENEIDAFYVVITKMRIRWFSVEKPTKTTIIRWF